MPVMMVGAPSVRAPADPKSLPRFPRRIAIVTSPTGAAIADMIFPDGFLSELSAATNPLKKAFGKTGDQITMREVEQAIAAFERTVIAGDSPFDRYQYGGVNTAMSPAAIRGLEVFRGQGRCVSCHVIEQTQALFTNNRFHNIGVSFVKMAGKEEEVVKAFLEAKRKGASVDIEVLTKENTSELGRFAVSEAFQDLGGFKTPTLRNVDKTAPYMHDGSHKTLEDVVKFYNNGGRLEETDPLSPYLDGGIRPLNLSEEQQADLVEFLKALTSPQFAKQ